MYTIPTLDRLSLLLGLSEALELASPALAQHQLRTAFIAWEIGKVAQLAPAASDDLFMAALLHDAGALTPEEKISIFTAESSNTEPHCILGEALLGQVPLLRRAAAIVRLHHTPWQEWPHAQGTTLSVQAQALALADTLDRAIDRSRYILHQDQDLVSHIGALAGTVLDPGVVEMFRAPVAREDFWLNIVSPRLYQFVSQIGLRGTDGIAPSELGAVSELFRDLIDLRSRFTATHSSGVATAAAELACLMGAPTEEIEAMRIAGNLHDLGKMAIPNSLLEKPASLSRDEYATMRQHAYASYSVLSGIEGLRQIAEWAALHHEKLDGSGYPLHWGTKQLSQGSRLMAVADIFTALAEDRPYRKGLPREEVMAILHGASRNGRLDPGIVDVVDNHYDELAEVTRRDQARARRHYEERVASDARK